MKDLKADTYKIAIEPAGKEIRVKEGQTVLDAAIRNGLQVPYGCRHGSCGACKALVLEGDYELMDRVSEYSLLGFEKDQGYILMCSTIAQSDMVVEIEEEEEPGLNFFPVCDFRAAVAENVRCTDDIHLIRLQLEQPQNIAYAAGQYVEVDIPGLAETRAYSMGARYEQGRLLEFHVRRVKGGRGSNYLCDLQAGDVVTGSGPYGKMQLRDREKDLLFIAGGSGMAPIKALIEELFSRPYVHQAWFFYGARTERDLYLTEEWLRMQRLHSNLHFVPALSDSAAEEDWGGERGYIADVVARTMDNINHMDAYLCGPPVMIESSLQVLYKRGLKSANIFYDEF